MDKIDQIKKKLFTSMKIMDITIKGIEESEEYKIAQAYNQGLRDAMSIFEREIKCCSQDDFDSCHSIYDREAVYNKEGNENENN